MALTFLPVWPVMNAMGTCHMVRNVSRRYWTHFSVGMVSAKIAFDRDGRLFVLDSNQRHLEVFEIIREARGPAGQ